MKHIFTLIFILLSFMQQAQTWTWAQSPVSDPNGEGDGTTMCTDASGNVFISGIYSGSMTAGTYSIANGFSYFGKYNSAGVPQWLVSASTSILIYPYGACADQNGNSYFTGYFTLDMSIGNFSLSSLGSSMFLVKFDPNGNVLWLKQPTFGSSYGYGNSCDAAGNIYVAGSFDSSAVFGSYTLSTVQGTNNIFLAKYNPAGNVLWAKQSTGTANDYAYSVSSDAVGNAYITGAFNSSVIAFGTPTLANGGGPNIFIAKYDMNGNIQWARNGYGNALTDAGMIVCHDGASNVYMAGHFTSNPLVLGTTTLSNPTGQNMLLAKYDASGNLIWVRTSTGGTGSTWSMSADANNIFVCGTPGSTTTFGSYTLVAPMTSDPAYLVQYNSSGTAVYASMLESGGDDYLGVAVDHSCHVYMSGDFATNTYTLGSNTLTLTGGESAFVAKLSYSCQGQPDGLAEVNRSSSPVKIYPNPSAGEFTIETEEKNPLVSIYNLPGEKVFEKRVETSSELLKTALPPGIYICRIESAGKIKEEKLLIH
jgi:hypothetical protein